MEQSHRIARIPLSISLLEQMLPTGSQILDVEKNKYYDTIELIVSHHSFKELENGECIPTKALMMHKSQYPVISKVEYSQ